MSELNTISVHKIRSLLQANGHNQGKLTIRPNKSFHIADQDFPNYVEPMMTPQKTSMGVTDYNKAKIILISAPGATGKSAMTQHLSFSCGIPVFDLAVHEPVASYSLVGMLFQTLPPDELGHFTSGLNNGSQTIIIDALDESLVKSGQASFDTFLTDLANMARNSQGIPFVCFGRTSVLEYVSLFFEEQNIPVSMLMIEPFLIEQAKQFIDNRVGDRNINKYADDYQKVRDYIINSIGAFFKSESDISKKAFENFIGYAPVLIAISTLLCENKNYHSLLQDLQDNNQRNIKLVVSILDMILNREREKLKTPIQQILGGRSSEFSNQVIEQMYEREEQCARLLFKYNNLEYHSHLTDDESFNREYDKFISEWKEVHPFSEQSGKSDFANVVFQAYCISVLLKNKSYHDCVIDYLSSNRQKHNSYLLYYLYKDICSTEAPLNIDFLPYLVESFQLIDRTQAKSRVAIISDDDDNSINNTTFCDVLFSRDGEKDSTCFNISIKHSESISFHTNISNLTVDARINIVIDNNNLELTAPITINCQSLKIITSEMRLTAYSPDDSIVIEAPDFISETSSGDIQTIIDRGNVRTKIFTNSALYFPIVKYKEDISDNLLRNDSLFERYQKLRHIILHFRSNGKGVLAKYKEKINNRIGRKPIGHQVLDALLKNGVIYEKDTLYYIEEDNFSKVLGVNFSGIRSYELSDKMISFLNSIDNK